MNDIHIKTADDIIYHLVRDPIRLIVDELVMIEVEFIIGIISQKIVILLLSTFRLSTKMETTLSVPSKLIVNTKFKIFELGTTGGCGISKEITLFNLFCYCRPKYP